jgi:hypothetical protein
VARSKDRFGLPGWNVITHSCVGNNVPNRKLRIRWDGASQQK